MPVTYSIVITGKVQGVFFRQSTREKARSLNIKGTVSNQPDGSVKIIASGTKEQMDELINWCRQGPPKARVDIVTATEIDEQEFTDFTIIR